MNLPFLVGLALALFGVYLSWHAVASYRIARASEGWPSVDGRLGKVVLWGLLRVDGEMKDVERLAVAYDYEVDGVRHTGSTVAFYTLVYPETLAFAQRHPVDSGVRVYYNAGNPAQSVLVPGLRQDKPHSDLILALLAVATGAAIAAAGWMGVIG